MPDTARALDECLQALQDQRNLQDVLRRYPHQRDELIALLRLSVDLNELSTVPPADPAFRLRARNRMLSTAARRRGGRWTPAGIARRLLPRPAVRAAGLALAAGVLVVTGLTVAAADSLPGQPLYVVKTGFEQVQLAVTLDAGANARLRLQLAERRLQEAQRLIALGQVGEGLRLINEYDSEVGRADQSLATATLDQADAGDLVRFLGDRQVQDDARLNDLARGLQAHGNAQAAAAVTRARGHADKAYSGRQRALETREGKHDQGHAPQSSSP